MSGIAIQNRTEELKLWIKDPMTVNPYYWSHFTLGNSVKHRLSIISMFRRKIFMIEEKSYVGSNSLFIAPNHSLRIEDLGWEWCFLPSRTLKRKIEKIFPNYEGKKWMSFNQNDKKNYILSYLCNYPRFSFHWRCYLIRRTYLVYSLRITFFHNQRFTLLVTGCNTNNKHSQHFVFLSQFSLLSAGFLPLKKGLQRDFSSRKKYAVFHIIQYSNNFRFFFVFMKKKMNKMLQLNT